MAVEEADNLMKIDRYILNTVVYNTKNIFINYTICILYFRESRLVEFFKSFCNSDSVTPSVLKKSSECTVAVS